MAPSHLFLNREKFLPFFRKGSVVILGNTYDTDDIFQRKPQTRQTRLQL
jgi:hypothetical protein